MKNSDLRYVQDSMPGWRRVRRGRGFSYLTASGQTVLNAAQLERVRRLAIPPAYTDVWICPSARGHLQATGRDARGRKQYRYHAAWRSQRDLKKFGRMREFGRRLPHIRRAVARDLRSDEPRRRTVVAAIVRLLDRTAMRVGNAEYAEDNGSFGLTTLRDRHVQTSADEIVISFRGKGGIEQRARLTDRHAARIVQRCQDLPGQHLFQYIDETGRRRAVSSHHVNAYLREVGGEDFTAKDFRTWHASVHALEVLSGLEMPPDAAPVRSTWSEVVRQVAQQIGNTEAVCRKFYIHPAVQRCFEERWAAPHGSKAHGTRGLRATECALMALLARRPNKAAS